MACQLGSCDYIGVGGEPKPTGWADPKNQKARRIYIKLWFTYGTSISQLINN